ncbi:MFS transporter [Pseudomonas sp. SDO5271_S396]
METTASHFAPENTGEGHRLAVSRARSTAAVLALSLGCFSFVSTELMPVGVLPSMAAGLDVSLGQAGYLVSCFAFVVALTAAPLTGLLGSINRKALMAILLAVCCAGNLVTWLAPSYAVVLVGRLLVAAAIGVFWSTAVVTAVYLVHARNAVRATQAVFAGVSLATVLGIPAGTVLGEHLGWRAVFAGLGALSLVVFVAVTWSVPAVRISGAATRDAMGRVLRSGPLLAVFAATALIVTGNFLAYTYITPYLEQLAQMSALDISRLLLVYGGAGVVANFVVGPFAGKSLKTCLVLVTALMAAGLVALGLALVSFMIILAIWGAAYGAIPVLLQTSVFKGAALIEGGADAATSINVAVFNAAIGLGALIGGLIINGAGVSLIPPVAAGFVLAGLGVVVGLVRKA